MDPVEVRKKGQNSLYTDAQRIRRDNSKWTWIQGLLAPLQFLVCLISLILVIRYLTTGNGLDLAILSVLIKTIFLFTIMVTGALWEHDVFGQYLFAEPFYWEDVVSMLVIALHTLYVVVLLANILDPAQQFMIALAAYAAYFVNASQFIYKFRLARKDAESRCTAPSPAGLGATS